MNLDSNSDKVKGSFNSTVGSIKEGAGKLTGNQDLEAEGSVQKTKGRAQKVSGAVKDTIKNTKDLLGIKPAKP